MDPRLESTLENYEKNPLGLDSTFKFRCTMCGKCCIHRDDILLNPRDLFNIAKELDCTPVDVATKYCEGYIGQDSRLPIVRLKPQGKDERCPLLKGARCSVHSAKPTVCALFPLGRLIKYDSSQPGVVTPDMIGYVVQKVSCGDKRQEHTVRDWLAKFNIPLEDAFFIKWQKFVVEAHFVVVEMEKKLSESTFGKVINFILTLVYFNYDMTKEFYPQFAANADAMTQKLQELTTLLGGDRE